MCTKFFTAVSFVGTLLCASAAHAQNSQLPPPWKWTDVGAVGTPGSVTAESFGNWHVSGAGSDIWGIADSFVYAYQPIRDGFIVAGVTSESNTSPFAKSGVMIRQTLDPGSPEVILDVKPDGGIEFMKRSTQGGETAFVAGGSVPVTSNSSGGVDIGVTLRLTRTGSTVSAEYCQSTCTTVGSTDFPGGLALIGLAVTSHDPSRLNDGYFRDTPFVSTLPYPWMTYDLGDVTTPGYATYENATGTFYVSGDGSDIWGTADSFHAATQALYGDSQLTARVVSEQNTNPFAKAGLTIGFQDASAARVILDVKPDGGIEFMARPTAGAPMSFIAGSTASFPVWLRLTRTGDQFTGEISPDGNSWTTVGVTTVSMPSTPPCCSGPTVLGGFAVTSHEPAVLNAAVFDNFAITTGLGSGPFGPNVLVNPGFEDSVVPNTAPGWISDTPLRQTPAVTEMALPHSGTQNAACRTTSGDCGIYQEVGASRGTLVFSIYARADHPGALVGVSVDGQFAGSLPITPGGYQRYSVYFSTFRFTSSQNPTIRVWMYAPATAGVVAVDDAELDAYLGPQ